MGKTISPNGDKWLPFVEAWKKAHPFMRKSDCYAKRIEKWKAIRDDRQLILKTIAQFNLTSHVTIKQFIESPKSVQVGRNLENSSQVSLQPLPNEVNESELESPASTSTQQPLDVTELEQPVDVTETVTSLDVAESPTPKIKRPCYSQDAVKAKISELLLKKTALEKLRNLQFSSSDFKNDFKLVSQELEKMQQKLVRLQQNRKASLKRRRKEALRRRNPTSPDDLENESVRKGRPPLERDQPGIMDAIIELTSYGASADEKRRTEGLRNVKKLDDLLFQLVERGYNISRTALYYRLLPKNARNIDGRRHVNTVNVRLVKAANDLRAKHEDSHFAAATVKYVKSLAELCGEKCVLVISQDDKARIPLGLPAARLQSPILMRMDYRVRLPDHDWVVAERHKLIPSVYAVCKFKDDKLTYSGPTFIAIRSGKHCRSTARTHREDLHRLIEHESFKSSVSQGDRMKPILILFVDGGPDEAPRATKTLNEIVITFKKFDLDAVFVVTHAPGQSAYNQVERRMAPLSRELSGVILPHDTFGSHLNSSGKTIDKDLELLNFEKAGEVLAEIWNNLLIDKEPVVAEYKSPAECQTGTDTGVPGTDTEGPSDLIKIHTAKWIERHVRQSQYLLQVVKCDNTSCCKPMKTNIKLFMRNGFLPPPIKFAKAENGIVLADLHDPNGHFFDLTTRLALNVFIPSPEYAFDSFCPSVKEKIAGRTCQQCGLYHATIMAKKLHLEAHKPLPVSVPLRQVEMSFEDVEEDFEVIGAIEMNDEGIMIIENLDEWMQPTFDVIGSSKDERGSM